MHVDSLCYPGMQSLLDVRALRKSFARGLARAQSRTFALLDVDLTVSWGEVACVSGDESSGKTALLQCLAGLLKRDSGSIRWFGEPMHGGVPPRDVIFVSATPLYYPFLTVRDVVQPKARSAPSEKVTWSARETLGMLELDKRLDSSIADLTRSELRSLAVAEAIVQRPLAILIDTAPSELRCISRAVPRTLCEFAKKGGAVIVAMRDPLAFADAATQIIVLDEGVVKKTFYSDIGTSTPRTHASLLLAETLH